MTTAIVLAAGQSTRMGQENKLLLRYGTRTFAGEVIEQLKNSAVGRIILVTGYESDALISAVDVDDVDIVVNEHYRSGMTSSIQAGVAAANKSSGYLICLGDMPLLRSEDYDRIIQAVNGQKQILVPFYQKTKGNPVYFSSHFREEILQHQQTSGCRDILKNNSEYVRGIPFDHDRILKDIDTPEDYKRMRR